MSLRNTTEKFGIITKFFHWVIVLLFILQFYLVYRREYFPKGSEIRTDYILWHKAFGIIILGLGIFFLLWHHLNKRPQYPAYMPIWERILAKFTHVMLFLSMLAMPITGYMMSAYANKGITMFGWYDIPLLLEPNKEYASLLHSIHEYISYAIIALVSLHVIGALKHHIIDKNNILTRMLPFGS